MSRLIERTVSSTLIAALLASAVGVRAQTIADYSRAQRAVIESAMTQAAARSAAAGASAPTAVAPVTTGPVSMPRIPLPAPRPAVRVSGVFASDTSTLAEVLVDAAAYLLSAGQGVPGTAWRVESVAVDRVVLSRRLDPAIAGDTDGVRKSFALPALR